MLGRLIEQRLIQDPQWGRWAADADHSPMFQSRRVDENSAMGLLAVYSAVKVISDIISTLPVDIYRGKGSSRTEVPNPPAWVEDPNVDMTIIELVGQMVISILLRGNSYTLKILNSMGQVLELWPLHPDWVQVKRVSFGSITTKEFTLLGKPVSANAILHIPGPMMPGSVTGIDPITTAAHAFRLGIDAQDFGKRFFQNSAIPAGVITAPGNVTIPQAKEIKDQWQSVYGGVNNAHSTALLSGGATYQAITISPEQAQFLETRRYTDDQIYRLFGLGNPLHTDEAGAKITYANVEQISTDVMRFALLPVTIRIEKALSDLLPRPQYWKFNFDSFLRADLGARYQAYALGLQARFLETNEVRGWEDLPPMKNPQPPVQPPAPNPGTDNANT